MLTNLAVDPQHRFAIRLAGGVSKLTEATSRPTAASIPSLPNPPIRMEVLAGTTGDGPAGSAAGVLGNLFGDETCRAEAPWPRTSPDLSPIPRWHARDTRPTASGRRRG